MPISLNAVAIVGPGVSVTTGVSPQRLATMYVTGTAGKSAVLTLEGLIDGTTWVDVGTSSIASDGYINSRSDGPLCTAFRANVKSISGGTVTASINAPDQYNGLNYYTSVLTFASAAEISDVVSNTGSIDVSHIFSDALAASKFVYVPPGKYRIDSTISIPSKCSLVGSGYNSNISANAIAGPAIYCNTIGPNAIKSLRISGSATKAMHILVSPTITIDDIHLDGLTCTDGFVFESVWGSSISNLFTNGALITNAGFICGKDFNANYCANWYHSNTGAYGLYVDGTYNSGNGVSHGSFWNNICIQSCNVGIFVGSYQGFTLSGYYSENVVLPLRLGDFAASHEVAGFSLVGGSMGGPNAGNANYANRAAVIELDYCAGGTIDGVNLSGAYNCGTAAPLSFSGGGGAGAFAQARVNVDGTIHSVEVLCGGSAYATPPTVIIGGSGSSAVLTASVGSGLVTSIAVTNPGTGYVPANCPVAIRYHTARRVSIGAIFFNSGFADTSPLYPWIVRKTGANSGSGVQVKNDCSFKTAAQGNTAFLAKTKAYGFTHALVEYDSAGAQVAYVYTPPLY